MGYQQLLVFLFGMRPPVFIFDQNRISSVLRAFFLGYQRVNLVIAKITPQPLVNLKVFYHQTLILSWSPGVRGACVLPQTLLCHPEG